MTELPAPTDVPPALLEHEQWICWREQSRGEKPTKVPVNPTTGRYASTNNPQTWVCFEDAVVYADDNPGNGIGFVFTDADSFVGVDLDDARTDDGEPVEWAASIIDQLDSYTEVSPSRTGYHVLVEGTLPPGRNRRGDVELYETGRFFTVTGDRVEGSPTTIHERTAALTTIYETHVAADASETDTVTERDDQASETAPSESESGLTDEGVLKRARSAANGAKFERLWRGDIAGYDSPSEADMALCCLLAFWTDGGTSQMDRLFRRSGLHREKWDAVHYADGSTYGEMTIDRATNVTRESYSPSDDGVSTDTDTGESDGDDQAIGMSMFESTGAATNGDTALLHERERERIETITELERRLRALELENERLRDDRDRERARRQELEGAAASNSTGSQVLGHLKRLLGLHR